MADHTKDSLWDLDPLKEQDPAAEGIREDACAEEAREGLAAEDSAKESGKKIEELLEEVEEIIRTLESGEIPLEDSFLIYEKGMKLVAAVNSRIDKVEKKIIRLEARGGDSPEETPGI